MSPEPTVLVRGLSHSFGSGESRRRVLHEIELELAPGEVVIVTGPSGSGKTTLLTLIGALRSVQEGALRVLGHDYARMGPRDLVAARRGIGFIFQAHNLFDSLTALRNVRMAVELHGVVGRRADAAAAEALESVGLGDRLAYKPQRLSGGQRQRVAIARALVNHPKLVLADEPTAALDEASGRTVVELLKRLAAEQNSTVLVVTHDQRVLDYADRVVHMVDGRIASDVLIAQSLEICEFLRRSPVFESMTPEELTGVSQEMEIDRFRAGAVIIRQGDAGDRFYILREGAVEVRVERDGETRVVETLGPGESFGEAALMTGDPRNATVVALSDVAVYSLAKDAFQSALESSASFSEQLRDVFFQRR